MGTATKHPVPARITVWHRMLYSCICTATVGVKGLNDWRTRDTYDGPSCYH